MTKPRMDSLDLVNDSGYPFQLLVEQKVKSEKQSHGWDVFAREKPWRDQTSGEEGYIDLILAHEDFRVVTECKCPKEPQDWIFLIERGRDPTVNRVCCLSLDYCGEAESSIKPLIVWKDSDYRLGTFESDFCVREQDDKNKPLLEKQSRTLLRSVECLAEEEHALQQEKKIHQSVTYIPMIVTTAKLKVCVFQAADVRIEDGRIPDGSAKIEQVDYIRFRKTILTKYPTSKLPQDLAEANYLQQRTILVVQAHHLSKLLFWL